MLSGGGAGKEAVGRERRARLRSLLDQMDAVKCVCVCASERASEWVLLLSLARALRRWAGPIFKTEWGVPKGAVDKKRDNSQWLSSLHCV